MSETQAVLEKAVLERPDAGHVEHDEGRVFGRLDMGATEDSKPLCA